jgi:hypothetical protein
MGLKAMAVSSAVNSSCVVGIERKNGLRRVYTQKVTGSSPVPPICAKVLQGGQLPLSERHDAGVVAPQLASADVGFATSLLSDRRKAPVSRPSPNLRL